jgi:hypothetical protein
LSLSLSWSLVKGEDWLRSVGSGGTCTDSWFKTRKLGLFCEFFYDITVIITANSNFSQLSCLRGGNTFPQNLCFSFAGKTACLVHSRDIFHFPPFYCSNHKNLHVAVSTRENWENDAPTPSTPTLLFTLVRVEPCTSGLHQQAQWPSTINIDKKWKHH